MENGVPFYFWDSTQGKAAAGDYGAMELLARKINQPGKIQGAGVLLGVEIKTGFITACSKNTKKYLGLMEEHVLGKQLVSLFTCHAKEISALFEKVGPKAFSTRLTLLKRNVEVDVTCSRAEDWVLVEVEEVHCSDADRAAAAAAAASAGSKVNAIRTPEDLHEWIVQRIQTVAGFDRVKVYKFHADQHGEVLAEALRGDVLDSCLYLHYPATDIPQRARELFLLNQIRFIGDVGAEQIEVVCLPDSAVNPNRITMSSCCLRAVHQCHIDYLTNMKVSASLTFAIVIKHKLWGLVACHHGAGPKVLARSIRNDCWQIVQAYSARLATLHDEQGKARSADLAQLKTAIQLRLGPSGVPSRGPSGEDGEGAQESDGRSSPGYDERKLTASSCMDLFQCVVDSQGFAYVSPDTIATHGAVPSHKLIRHIQTALDQSAQPGLLDSRSLSALLDGSLREESAPGERLGGIVGVLAVRCVRGCILMWFRQEYVREVQWGGRHTPLPEGVFGARQSFEAWAESVRGECNPWTERDEEDVIDMAEELDRIWFSDASVERMATSTRGDVLQWNEPMEKLVCMSASKAVGQNISNLCYHCDKEDVENMLASIHGNQGERWTAHLNIYTQKSTAGASFHVWKRRNAASTQVFVFESLSKSSTPAPSKEGTPEQLPIQLPAEGLFRVPQDVLILDEVTDLTWIMDCTPDSTAYLWANKRACQTLSCTLSQFLCLDLKADFLDLRVRQLWYRKVQQQRQMVQCRQSFYSDKAIRLDLTVTPIQVETSHGTKMLCLVSGKVPQHDGMEGSRSMEMLQASKVMMMLFSLTGELLSGNVSAKVYYSTALAELSEQRDIKLDDVFESCVWESNAERSAAFEKMMQVCSVNDGQVYEMERVKRHKKAAVVHHIQLCAARDPETGALAIAVNETDISRLKSVQNELVAAQKQQERFLAATSHELRTPLHAILALSDTMAKNLDLPETALKMLKIIHSSGQQLASLVNDILDAAAIQAGALVLKNDLVQLHEITGGVIDLLSPMSPHSVRMINGVSDTLPALQLDASRLTQILTNLIGNACKFTRQGEIRVSAKMSGPNEDQVAITVSDTGRGIPEENIQVIWQAFQQLDPTVKGTGLGLSIVRNLVEAMGGMISVESSVATGSHGTTFTLILPRRPEDHARRLISEKSQAVSDVTANEDPNRSMLGGSPAGTEAQAHAMGREGLQAVQGAVPERDLQRELNATLAKLQARELELESIKTQRAAEQGNAGVVCSKCGNGACGDEEAEGEKTPVECTSSLPSQTSRSEETALATTPALQYKRRCLYLSDEGIEEQGRRVLEMLGLAPQVCSVSQAQRLLTAPEGWPDLEVVLVDTCNLKEHYDATASSWKSSQVAQVCEALQSAMEAQSILVVWLSTKPDDDLDAALAAGCTGVAALPLEADALQASLLQQRDLKRIWQYRALLHTASLFPQPRHATLRASALVQSEGVRCHNTLACVWLSLEFPTMERPTLATAQGSQVLGQLMQRCHYTVDRLADEHGAIVAQCHGDSYALVLGHQPHAPDPPALACFHLATALLLAFETSVLTSDGTSLTARVGLGLGKGYEAAVTDLPPHPATKGLPSGTNKKNASEAGRLAFFGMPLLDASAFASTANPGHIQMGDAIFKSIFPESKSDAIEYSYNPFSDAWAQTSRHYSEPSSLVPGTAPAPKQGRHPEHSQIGVVARKMEDRAGTFQGFAADMLRAARTAQILEKVVGPADKASRAEVRLMGILASRISRCVEQLFAPAVERPTCNDTTHKESNPDPEELLGGATILSVDDSPVNQLVMESILRPLVKGVRTCMDGPDALDILTDGSELPDIILLDVMMPTLSGIEVCAKVRERYSPTQLPIVLVSGKSSKESIVQGLAAGANDYITKPFDTGELISRVKAQLMASAMAKAEVEVAGIDELRVKMLPPIILRSWTASDRGEPVAEELASASVLCASIEGFSALTQQASPLEVMQTLSSLWSGFDSICDRRDAWKVHSAADCYMVVARPDSEDNDDHAGILAGIGLDMIRLARSITHPCQPGSIKIRVTLHTGPVKAGVVNGTLPRYFVCGAPVEIASSMLQTATAMSVIVSAVSQKLLVQFNCVSLGRGRVPEDRSLETFVVQDKTSAWEAAVTSASQALLELRADSPASNDGPDTEALSPTAALRPSEQYKTQETATQCRVQENTTQYRTQETNTFQEERTESVDTRTSEAVPERESQRERERGHELPACDHAGNLEVQRPRRLSGILVTQHCAAQHCSATAAQEQEKRGGGGSVSSYAQERPTGSRGSEAPISHPSPMSTPQSRVDRSPSALAIAGDLVPLSKIFEKAKLSHMVPALVSEGVDVDFLANAGETELKGLGIENISDRARIRRYAQAWTLLFG